MTSVFRHSPHWEIFKCFFCWMILKQWVDFILNVFTAILHLKERLSYLWNPRWRARERPFCWCSLRLHHWVIQETLKNSKSLWQQHRDVSPTQACATSLQTPMPCCERKAITPRQGQWNPHGAKPRLWDLAFHPTRLYTLQLFYFKFSSKRGC